MESLVNGFRLEGQRSNYGTKAGFVQATIHYALSSDDLREQATLNIDEIISVAKQAQ